VEPVEYVLSLAEAGLAEMRALIFELRPESLEIEGLVVALDKQVAATAARYGIEVTSDLIEEPEMSLAQKEIFYRIGQRRQRGRTRFLFGALPATTAASCWKWRTTAFISRRAELRGTWGWSRCRNAPKASAPS
jgi:hypothetical protein